MSTNDENKIYPNNEDNMNEGSSDSNENFSNTAEENYSQSNSNSNTANSVEGEFTTQSIYSNQQPPVTPQPPKVDNGAWSNAQTTSTWSTPLPPQQQQQFHPQQQQYQQQLQQRQPNQQTQWTFQEQAARGGKPPKPPKVPKQGGNTGLKVFAVFVSILFVVSLGSLAGYIIYDTAAEPQNKQNVTSSAPQIDTNDKPKIDVPVVDSNGKMTAVEVNKKVGPSVVGIVSYVQSVGYQVAGQGSGIIMTADGYIVTNHHVITSDDPRYPIAKVEVFLSTGENYIATVVGSDKKTDIAVLKITASNLSPATFGDSSKLEVGEPVLVIGNPSGLEFAGSMTGGMVSAVNRELKQESIGQNNKYIQTNAAINPGNSGGALVNEYGQIVGVTSAKIVADGFEGMGFAIPINDVKTVVDSLIQNGYVKGRVMIGINYVVVSETFAKLNGIPQGLRVDSFEQGSQPDVQGVLPGDIITKMDGKDVYDSATIKVALDGKVPGDTMTLSIYRVDRITGTAKNIEITLTLTEDKGQ